MCVRKKIFEKVLQHINENPVVNLDSSYHKNALHTNIFFPFSCSFYEKFQNAKLLSHDARQTTED